MKRCVKSVFPLPKVRSNQRIAVAAAVAALLVPSSAAAIPSPDVIVNVFASAGQVLGLLSVIFGASFFQRRQSFGESVTGQRSTASRRLLVISLILLLLSVAANIMQYTSQVDARNRRLYTNLIRPSTEQGKKVGDTSLKTLSRSEQLSHPAGIDTQEFARLWRFNDFPQRYEFIDVRTPEEFEMGYIAGANPIVMPDLKAREDEFIGLGKPLILICESGNRSSELCTRFREAGEECHFLIGGFQKWVAEGRPTEGLVVDSDKRVRDIAPYPNKDVLLDTPEAHDLVIDQSAVFVDVRYPGDFERNHLPYAINIPIRKLLTKETNRRLNALPDRPIIAPCYDKRSCFYAMILGLRLTRMGKDYRGRYTVPHEFMYLDKETAYVQKWRTQNERTLFTVLRAPLEKLLGYIEDHVKSFVTCILLFVLALRLLFLPLILKNERDQVVLRMGEPELEELKKRTEDNKTRQSRAVLHWYKSHKITPVRNLLGALVQLFVFLMCFFVVQKHGHTRPEPFLWLDTAADKDSYFVLSTLVGLLAFACMEINAKRRTWQFVAMRGLACTALAIITIPLISAVNFYLVVNVALLLLQMVLVNVYFTMRRRSAESAPEEIEDTGLVSLCNAHRLAGSGNKAGRLGKLIEEGFHVSKGVVITDQAFDTNGSAMLMNDQYQKRLKRLLQRLHADKFAVRSSGLKEDGTEHSYAGVFDSLLNVELPAVKEAVEEVRKSLDSTRAREYSGESQCGGSVLIQEMVDAEYAGVLFTEHPAESGSVLVELTSGLGDELVSGTANALSFRYGRVSRQPLDPNRPPIALEPLLELGEKIENIFKVPQDIEWAYRNGNFHILQARDITTLARKGDVGQDVARVFERERHRLIEMVREADYNETVFEQNELCEMLPHPTPLSLSLIDRLWAPGGTADIACQSLRIPYDVPEDGGSLYTTVFGELYVNRHVESRRMAGSISAVTSFRLSRSAKALEYAFRQRFLPGFIKQMEMLAAVDFGHFDTDRLFGQLEEWVRHFVKETYVEAERINVAADFYLQAAERELSKRGLNPAAYLSDLPPSEPLEALALLPDIREGKVPLKEFLRRYGHRTFFDFELSQPRFDENPAMLEGYIEHFQPRTGKRPTPELPKGRLLRECIERARVFQSLKEDAKHVSLRELVFIRRLLLEIDRRWELGGGLFYLTIDELLQQRCDAPPSELAAGTEERRTELRLFESFSLPSKISLRNLEVIDFREKATTTFDSSPLNAALVGLLVAGNQEVVALARVIRDVAEIGNFNVGEILVTRFTTPQWTALFSKASGIVTEVGGWLSHAAILAREYNLTTIVGASGAVELIHTGDKIRLCLDGRIEQV